MNTPTASIQTGDGRLTLINVYEVDPARQAELSSLLSDETERTIRHHPGFVSVSIHTSLDGTKVVNYAQWASQADFEGFIKQPATQALLKRFAGIAKSVSPALYNVTAVHAASR